MGPGGLMVVGSANLDLVFRTARFPKAGETLMGRDFATFPGGKGANQAVAAGRLGGPVTFVGRVGRDDFGKQLRRSLEDAGVTVDHLGEDPEAATGCAGILVDDAGQNEIVVAPGANARLTAEEVQRAAEARQPSVVLAQLEVPLETAVAARGAYFVLNPAPAQALPPAVLSRVDLLTPNETETAVLTGIEPDDDASCLRAAAKLFDLGVKSVAITLGARGSFYATPDGGRHYPTINVRAVDTTAAGDAFNGALALFLAKGEPIERALPLANVVGALSATKPGAQASMPTWDEFAEAAAGLL